MNLEGDNVGLNLTDDAVPKPPPVPKSRPPAQSRKRKSSVHTTNSMAKCPRNDVDQVGQRFLGNTSNAVLSDDSDSDSDDDEDDDEDEDDEDDHDSNDIDEENADEGCEKDSDDDVICIDDQDENKDVIVDNARQHGGGSIDDDIDDMICDSSTIAHRGEPSSNDKEDQLANDQNRELDWSSIINAAITNASAATPSKTKAKPTKAVTQEELLESSAFIVSRVVQHIQS